MLEIVFVVIIYFFSIVIHEVAHGTAAYILGDPTAKDAGRLTLNPISHIDPVGTVLLPLLAVFLHVPLLGWAKPVPFNPMYFKNVRRGTFIVSAAGVSLNLILAVIFGSAVRILQMGALGTVLGISLEPIIFIFSIVTLANLALGLFNLVPIPPLDGSKILFSILGARAAGTLFFLEQWGFFILIGLIYFVPAFTRFLSLLIGGGFALLTGGAPFPF
jgi:Zn-dependent protease